MLGWQKGKNRIVTKIIALIIMQVFLVTNIGYTAPSNRSLFKNKRPDYESIQRKREDALQKKRDTLSGKKDTKAYKKDLTHPLEISSLKDLSSIYIPDSLGRVVDVYQAEEPHPLIVHIQDLHTNPEGQLNSAAILEILIKDYGLDLVCSEGAEGEVDTSSVSSFPDYEVREKTARLFVNSGELTGEEYLSITKYPELPIWGIEDRDIYFKNIIEFNKIMRFSEKAQVFITQVETSLEKLKPEIYSVELLEIDAKEKEYEENKIEPSEYIDYLLEKGPASGFPNITMLKESQMLERSMDQSKLTGESQDLILKLQSVLSQEKNNKVLDTLLARASLFKDQKISPFSFYSYLDELSRRHLTDELDKYPNLVKFVEYLSKVNSLDSVKLFQEIEEFTYQTKDGLSTNEDQKLISKALRHIKFLEGFFNLKVTNEELDYYLANKDDYLVRFFEGFLKGNLKKYNVDSFIDFNPEIIDARLSELESFYEIARKRDIAMFNNAINEIEKRNADVTALIAGGFHTRGLTELFKEKGYSYVVVSPYSNTEIDEENYRFLLSGKRRPVSELIEGLNNQLRVIMAYSSQGFQKAFNKLLERVRAESAIQQLELDRVSDRTISLMAAGKLQLSLEHGVTLDESSINRMFNQSFRSKMREGDVIEIKLIGRTYYVSYRGFNAALLRSGDRWNIKIPKEIPKGDIKLAVNIAPVKPTVVAEKPQDKTLASNINLFRKSEKPPYKYINLKRKKNIRKFVRFMFITGIITAASIPVIMQLTKPDEEMAEVHEVLGKGLGHIANPGEFEARKREFNDIRQGRDILDDQRETAMIETFINEPSYTLKVIYDRARKWNLDPAMVAGFIYEEYVNARSKGKVHGIREFLASLRASLGASHTLGEAQVNVDYFLRDKEYLDALYDDIDYFIDIVRDEPGREEDYLAGFEDKYYFVRSIPMRNEEDRKKYEDLTGKDTYLGEMIPALSGIFAVNIDQACYAIRTIADIKAKSSSLRAESGIPSITVLSGNSSDWIVDNPMRIPAVTDSTQWAQTYMNLFGDYYPPEWYIFVVARTYTNEVTRALMKVEACKKFYSLFKKYGEITEVSPYLIDIHAALKGNYDLLSFGTTLDRHNENLLGYLKGDLTLNTGAIPGLSKVFTRAEDVNFFETVDGKKINRTRLAKMLSDWMENPDTSDYFHLVKVVGEDKLKVLIISNEMTQGKKGDTLASGEELSRSLPFIAFVSFTLFLNSCATKDKPFTEGADDGKPKAAEVQQEYIDFFSAYYPVLSSYFSNETKTALNNILNEFNDNKTCVGKSLVKFTSKDGKRRYQVDLGKRRIAGLRFFNMDLFGAYFKIGWIEVETVSGGSAHKPRPGHNGLWKVRLPDVYRTNFAIDNVEEIFLKEATIHELRHIEIDEGLHWKDFIYEYLVEELGYGVEKAYGIFVAISEYITYNEGLKMAEELGHEKANPEFYKWFVEASLEQIIENRKKIPDAIFECLEYDPSDEYKAHLEKQAKDTLASGEDIQNRAIEIMNSMKTSILDLNTLWEERSYELNRKMRQDYKPILSTEKILCGYFRDKIINKLSGIFNLLQFYPNGVRLDLSMIKKNLEFCKEVIMHFENIDLQNLGNDEELKGFIEYELEFKDTAIADVTERDIESLNNLALEEKKEAIDLFVNELRDTIKGLEADFKEVAKITSEKKEPPTLSSNIDVSTSDIGEPGSEQRKIFYSAFANGVHVELKETSGSCWRHTCISAEKLFKKYGIQAVVMHKGQWWLETEDGFIIDAFIMGYGSMDLLKKARQLGSRDIIVINRNTSSKLEQEIIREFYSDGEPQHELTRKLWDGTRSVVRETFEFKLLFYPHLLRLRNEI